MTFITMTLIIIKLHIASLQNDTVQWYSARNDIQYNDTLYNDTLKNDAQCKDTYKCHNLRALSINVKKN